MGIGSKYTAISTGQEFELVSVTDRIGKRKLREHIYTFKYTNRDGQHFTCYITDIEKCLRLKVWRKI